MAVPAFFLVEVVLVAAAQIVLVSLAVSQFAGPDDDGCPCSDPLDGSHPGNSHDSRLSSPLFCRRGNVYHLDDLNVGPAYCRLCNPNGGRVYDLIDILNDVPI